nr:hypothetical protein [Streptomyces sp. E2N166]
MPRKEVATRAGMSMAHLRQVEERATGFDPGALGRLAAVPEMPYEELSAGRRDALPGQSGSAAHPVLLRLSEQGWLSKAGHTRHRPRRDDALNRE